MNDWLYISTNAFETGDVAHILKICNEYSLTNIELSTCDSYNREICQSLISYYERDSFHFLLHNYFPPPQKPFVLNLASDDLHISEISRQHCFDAVDLCVKLGSPFYSVHAGFCFHARPEQLGRKISADRLFSMKTSLEIFIENIQQVADYASQKNIILAIENNVIAPFNLVEGNNRLFLGVTTEELMDMIERIQRNNVKILIDVGHLKVSARTLGFSPHRFIKELSPHTIAIHLSDNDGFQDSHECVRKNSWFWEPLCTSISENVFWILEPVRLTMRQIVEQVSLITSYMER